MSNDITKIELHADSSRDRPLDPPRPGLTVSSSYLPRHVVLTLETPLRAVVVDLDQLLSALKSI